MHAAVCRDAVPPLPPRHQRATQSSDAAPAVAVADPHVQQLIDEGFDEISVTKALHLAKDNVQLARNILIEFGRR